MDRLELDDTQYRALLDVSPDPIIVIGPDGLITIVNDKAEDLFGYTPDELVGTPPGRLIAGQGDPAAVAEAIASRRARIFRTRRGNPLRGLRRDGSDFPAEVSLQQVRVQGQICVIAAVRDITELREAERQRREAENVLILGIRHSPVGIVIVDLDGLVTRVNPATCTLFGRSEEELLGCTLPALLHPDDAHRRPLYRRLLEEGKDSLQDERRYLRPDGETVWVEQIVVLVRDTEGEPVSFYLHLQDVTARKQAEAELEYLALHDPLTGLPNRRLLTEHLTLTLARAERATAQVAVMFIDLDQFKTVNDARGHSAGDDLLVQLALRLQGLIRDSDMFARFGGDEFVVVCDDITPQGAERLADRIVGATTEPFDIDGQEIYATVSVGIAMAGEGDTAESLLRKSDVAMYSAKDAGRAGAAVFDELMQQKASARMTTETELARAVRHGQFLLHFQPIVDVRTGEALGFEALVRWDHPDRGLLPPSEFLEVAEETGMIVPIGEWVLEKALHQLHEWEVRHPHLKDLTVSVNLSTAQLHDAGLVAVAERLLRESTIDPQRLQLEITESMVMRDVDLAVRNMAAVRDLGVRLAIDDFGAGYSSLGYLRRLPVHVVKIDKSFIDDLGSDPQASFLVDAILTLARALDLEVITEGVETQGQRDELHRLGVRYAQGYLWSKPLAPEDVPGWLAGP